MLRLARHVLVALLIVVAGGCASAEPVDHRFAAVGEPALDWTFLDAEKRAASLSDRWRERPLVVIWLRHYG